MMKLTRMISRNQVSVRRGGIAGPGFFPPAGVFGGRAGGPAAGVALLLVDGSVGIGDSSTLVTSLSARCTIGTLQRSYHE